MAGMTRTYLDAPYWRELAAKHGVRMPRSDNKGFPYVRWMRKLGVDGGEFHAVFACTPPQWRALNPDWTLQGFVGLLLEIVENRPPERGLDQ